MKISFGRKIPKIQCQIQNKETGKFIPATVYEVDCKDEADFQEIRKLDRKWHFRNDIALGMEQKHAIQTYLKQKSNVSFYAMKDNKGELIGLAQTKTVNGITDINYLTTKPRNEYKYVGQTMVAAIGKETLKKGYNQLTITTSIDETMDFYKKKCGFKQYGKYILRMNAEQIRKSVETIENRTKAQFINLKG